MVLKKKKNTIEGSSCLVTVVVVSQARSSVHSSALYIQGKWKWKWKCTHTLSSIINLYSVRSPRYYLARTKDPLFCIICILEFHQTLSYTHSFFECGGDGGEGGGLNEMGTQLNIHKAKFVLLFFSLSFTFFSLFS